jgi:hypothetical protein
MSAISVDVVLGGDSALEADAIAPYLLSAAFGGDSSIAPNLHAHYKASAAFSSTSGLAAPLAAKYEVTLFLAATSSMAATETVDLGFQAPVRYQPSSRNVSAGLMVLDQVDLFMTDGKTRSQGVTIAGLNLKLFFNGSQVDWPLMDGTNVQDVQVTAGKVYWTEFLAGFYTVRFYPNVIGAWRVFLTYPAFDQAVSLSYEVVKKVLTPVSMGLNASFIRR